MDLRACVISVYKVQSRTVYSLYSLSYQTLCLALVLPFPGKKKKKVFKKLHE